MPCRDMQGDGSVGWDSAQALIMGRAVGPWMICWGVVPGVCTPGWHGVAPLALTGHNHRWLASSAKNPQAARAANTANRIFTQLFGYFPAMRPV